MSPDVERLSDRLARVPPLFLAPIDPRKDGAVRVDAVVADLIRARASRPPSREEIARFAFPMRAGGEQATRSARRHLSVVLVASWLLYDDAFQNARAEALLALLSDGLRPLADLVLARGFVEDPERREELVRTCLAALGLAPAGEDASFSEDRLATLDSVRRDRLLREARERQAVQEKRRKELEQLRRQEEEDRRRAARTTFED